MGSLSQIYPGSATRLTTFWLLAVCCVIHAEPVTPSDVVELPRLAPTEAVEALATFQVRAGFRLEQVATEPLVTDPVAVCFDERGRLFVAEMRGYSERRDEELGRIRVLTDTDGDGRYDFSSVFAEGLRWPTGLICWKGGVFVIASPDILYCSDSDGDDRADSTEVVFSGFGSDRDRLNVQALPNSLVWGPDNRIHGATAMNGGLVSRAGGETSINLNGRDFSFDPNTLDIRVENGGGQYGMAFDSCGRKFVCSNSNHIQWIAYDSQFNNLGLPTPRIDIAVDGPSAEVFRTSPDEPWRIVRTRWRVNGQVPGPVEGGGRPSGYFTAATGITAYRGNAFGPEFTDNAFVCDAGSNLVHRKIVDSPATGHLLQAHRADDEQDIEFLTSSDNWFRPVQATNGPDGALYIVDMYREVIEHPWSLPEPIKSKLDLNSGHDRGRIYRIVPDSFRQPPQVALGSADTVKLVEALSHSNGWHRDTASRLLIERKADGVMPNLREVAKNGNAAPTRSSALQLLNSLNALDNSILLHALGDKSSAVRLRAILLTMELNGSSLPQAILPLAEDSNPEVAFQAALALSKLPATPQIRSALIAILEQHPSQPLCRAAVVTGLQQQPLEALQGIFESDQVFAHPAALDVIKTLLTKAPKPLPDSMNRLLKQRLDEIQNVAIRASLVNVSGISLPASEAAILSAALQTIALDQTSDIDSRVAAISQLPFLQREASLETLGKLITPSEAPALQQAALTTIGDTGFAEGGTTILESWKRLAPSLHRLALAQLFRRSAWRSIILTGLESKTIPASLLQPQQIQALRGTGSPANQARAKRILASSIQPARIATIAHYSPALTLEGRPDQGETIFSARCASCHRKGSIGTRYGPDVVTFQRAGGASILANLIDPDREIQPRYAAVSLETRSGAFHTGYLTNESTESVTIREPITGDRTVSRKSIAAMETLKHSTMPKGLEAGLSHQEMADLLAFIASQ